MPILFDGYGDTFHTLCAPLVFWHWTGLTVADGGHRKAQRSKGGQTQIPGSETAGHRRASPLSAPSKFLLLARKGNWMLALHKFEHGLWDGQD